MLGALQDAGGPSLTRPPLAGSAAIDAVPQASSTDYLSTVLVVDQRGFARPVNTKSDVGAYEFNDSGLAVNLGRIIHSQAAGVTTSTTLSVSSTGAVALTWTASENPATSWISLVPTSSSAAVAPGGSEQVQVVFDSTGLADGRYSTTLEFNGDDPGPTVEVPVLFCVPDPCGAADSPWPQFRNDTLNTGRSAIAGPDAAVEKWSYTTGGAIGFPSPSIGPDATIYVASGDNKLYAVNPDGTFKWSFLMGDSIVGSPAIAGDGTIYLASRDDYLYAINPDGTQKWKLKPGGGTLDGPPSIGPDGTIYLTGCGSGARLSAIDLDGTERWALTTPSACKTGSVAIGSDGTIYFGDWDGNLNAATPDGSLKWSYLTGDVIGYSSPAIGSDGTIYVGSRDDKLHAVNPDGTQKWSYTTTGDVDSSPAIGPDGTVYVGSLC